ncbi:MAG: hypothetical protein ACRC37_01750 [Lentisphaeria bacterium]
MKKIQIIFLPILGISLAILAVNKPWNYRIDLKATELKLKTEKTINNNPDEILDLQDFLSEGSDLNQEKTNSMWQKNLFSPNRTEDENSANLNQNSKIENSQFELTGLAAYGDVKLATIQIKAASARNVPQNYNRAARGSATTPAINKTASTPSRRSGQTNVVKVGEEVGDTSYILQEIFFGERTTVITKENDKPNLSYVVIQRGADKITLYLDKSARAAVRLSEQVAAAKREEQSAAARPQPVAQPVDRSTLTPPPPPPAPGSVDASAAERLRNARNLQQQQQPRPQTQPAVNQNNRRTKN